MLSIYIVACLQVTVSIIYAVTEDHLRMNEGQFVSTMILAMATHNYKALKTATANSH